MNDEGWSVEVVTRSPGQTRAVGAAIAGLVDPGDVVLLVGELGSGKTVLTKGLVTALGGGEATTSPTFVLCHLYPTTPPVAHVDCYRLAPSDDLADLALDEALEDGSVVVVEWGEHARGLLGAEALECLLSPVPAEPSARPGPLPEDSRLIVLAARGKRWSSRSGALVAALERAGLAVARRAAGGSTPR